MAQICVLEQSVEIKSNPEKFYNFLKNPDQKYIPNKIRSENLHGVEIHQGSVKLWKYSIDGKDEIFKERVELDEVNKTISYVAVGGNPLEVYKSYKVILKVESGILKVRLEYEKLNNGTPPPKRYQQFVINVVKDTDANLVKGY